MVLGLKWLRDINPDVDWASLSLVFRKERLAGAISMLLPEKKGKTTIEEIPDEDSPIGPPQDGPLFPRNDEPGEVNTPPDTKHPSPKPPPKNGNQRPNDDNLRTNDTFKESPKVEGLEFPPAQEPAPKDSNIDIKIIGAAPFARLIRDGIEIYQLHISPVLPTETLRAEQPQDPQQH
jgi:hypothetical protein